MFMGKNEDWILGNSFDCDKKYLFFSIIICLSNIINTENLNK